MKINIYFETLGCAKNEVDSWKLQQKLSSLSWKINKKPLSLNFIEKPEEADFIILNTCGFILPAKEESINRFFTFYSLKENGTLKDIILIGCLVERYFKELQEEITETEFLLPIRNYAQLPQILKKAIEKHFGEQVEFSSYTEEKSSLLNSDNTKNSFSYVKIADGCNNRCSYCAIPIIRGNFRSFSQEQILQDIEEANIRGIKEINLIAQDTTMWKGNKGEDLGDLIQRINKLFPHLWVRVLYMHPAHLTEKILQKLQNAPNFLPYFDLPLQHISDKLLSHMRRRISPKEIYSLLEKIKKYFSNAIIRSTFIIGHPLEEEEDFEKLYNFIGENLIQRCGFFPYSHEEGTLDYQLKPLEEEIIIERLSEISSLYDTLHLKWAEDRIGESVQTLVEEELSSIDYPLESPYIYGGRSYQEAPDDDPYILIESPTPLEKGKFIPVSIYDALAYNPIAKLEKNL